MSYYCYYRQRWVRGTQPRHHRTTPLPVRRAKRPHIKKKIDHKQLRHERLLARIKLWQSKKRRAETALRKLNRQLKQREYSRIRPLKETVADLQSYGFDNSDVSKLIAVGGVSCRQ